MAYSQDRSQGYILVVGRPSNRGQRDIERHGGGLRCPVVMADSLTQAIAITQNDPPHLVILSGSAIHQWSPRMAKQLRDSAQSSSLVIVAITDSSELSWEAEPRETGLDGFFVEPISSTVLSALNVSAIAKHRYLQCA